MKSILFGPTSLSSKKPPLPITQGKVWGTTFVTPGAIALTAILVSSVIDTGANLELLTIPKAIFLHSPDCEFAEIGAKSDIPYRTWFNLFKEFLMKNSTNPDIEALFKWWNGRVFTFDTTNKQGVKTDDMDSGMDEAELVLAGHDFSDSIGLDAGNSQVNDYEEELQFIGTFNTLTIDMEDSANQPPPSHTPADSCASSSHCESVVQPAETGAQNPAGNSKRPSTQKAGGSKSNRKGKGKAVVFVNSEAGLEAEELIEMEGTTVSGRKLRSRRK